MRAYILGFREKKWESYLTPILEEPMIRIVERRLLNAKRIDEVFTIVRKSDLKKFSLHVSNPIGVNARNKLEALHKALPFSGDIFLVEGNMPLVMPFLVNYLSTLFYESYADALIPMWADGSLEVTHAFYNARALRKAVEACLSENERRISCIAEYLDYETVSIEELIKKNPKVSLSFLKVKTPFDIKFAEENLKSGL
ncbi:molybdenum cofactor guanylyltransferase [Thermococcus aggregans]|uniref:Molybdenum cofactor guanylyltransferase n=1 Tax=Thermococcus aggregans TaxID=110163 RepID=A0A9E7MYL6_THEAG|nr:NTP transferase domain-containing protein [Thermococcus aggregans]USS41308.1 molybdenum cofactor guanylyltransferase [Thermococcus aggregans]